MKKVRKGKKILIIALIAIVAILVVVLIVTKVVKKKPETQPGEPVEQEQTIPLPETTTNSGMDVQRVYMEYLKDNNQTMITMTVTNNTSKKVEDEEFNAILIGPDENVLGKMRTGTNVDLDIGEQCEISVIYKGDLTSTKQIKLEPIQ